MRRRGWSALDLAVALAVLTLILLVVLQTRRVLWSSHVDDARAAVKDFAEALARHQRRHGHLPGDVNRDGAIDAAEAEALRRTVEIAGRTVVLRVIAREASAVANPPRGRNVIELWNLPCHVVRELDERIDDGNFAKGNVRASVSSCAIGGENDPMPVVAVAIGA
jgi:hypothetical protein